MIHVLRVRRCASATVIALKLSAIIVNWGCEKSLVSYKANTETVPITSEIKWEVILTDSRANFGLGAGVAFDSSATFGLVRGSGGWFRTVDGGRNWFFLEALGSGPQLNIVSPTVAYAWRPPVRTEDGGKTWYALSGPFSASAGFEPAAEYVAFAWENQNLWRTEDGGRSWTATSLSKRVIDVTSANGKNIVAVVQDSSSEVLFFSADAGRSWERGAVDTTTLRNSGRGWLFQAARMRDSEIGVAGASTFRDASDSSLNVRTEGIFRTSDGGRTWEKVFEFRVLGNALISFTHAKFPRWHILARSGSRLNPKAYVSEDDGRTWEAGADGDFRVYDYYRPSFAPPDWRIGIAGPYMTQDGGKTWTERSWYVRNAAFLNAYEVIGVRDSVILRGTAP